MRRSTIVCLLISVWLAFGCASSRPDARRLSAYSSREATNSGILQSDSQTSRFRAVVTTPKSRITGICILKRNGDEVCGTLVNEFGVKAFDFVVDDRKCRLLNVIPVMNKWYVRKVIASDLYFLINADRPGALSDSKYKRIEHNDSLTVTYGKKQISTDAARSVARLINSRHRLQYEFYKIE